MQWKWLQPGPHPPLGQGGVANSKAVRVVEPFDGVFKHLGSFAGETLELTGVQNARELRVPVNKPAMRDRRTDIRVTPISMTNIFITGVRFRHFFRCHFRTCRGAVLALLEVLFRHF